MGPVYVDMMVGLSGPELHVLTHARYWPALVESWRRAQARAMVALAAERAHYAAVHNDGRSCLDGCGGDA